MHDIYRATTHARKCQASTYRSARTRGGTATGAGRSGASGRTSPSAASASRASSISAVPRQLPQPSRGSLDLTQVLGAPHDPVPTTT